MQWQLKNTQQGVSHSSLAVKVAFVPCIKIFAFVWCNLQSCAEGTCWLASLKSFLPVADCYELDIYSHLPAQQGFDHWSVSWSSFFFACKLRPHDHFPYYCVAVVTVNDVQGYIKHSAGWAGTGHSECLVFPSGLHQCEVSDVPFFVSHPRLQMWKSKRCSGLQMTTSKIWFRTRHTRWKHNVLH